MLRELAYRHDAIGNIKVIRDDISGDVEHQAFHYDGLHRLTGFEIRRNNAMGQVLQQGGYSYDAAGNVQAFEESAPLQLTYRDATHPNRVTSVQNGAAVMAFHVCDHHSTVLLSCDAAGAIVDNQRYTAFGAPRTAAGLDRYLGRPRDPETGLLHLGARYYAPSIGRFLSFDWWVLENPTKPLRIPQGYNVYSHAINNPLVFKDPSGLWFGIDDLIVAAVGFVVGFVSGLIYGLANGQGWDSLLTALETGLTTAAGAWLGWTVGGVVGAVMGGMNGLMSGNPRHL